MASPAEIRATLRDAGVSVPVKGPLSDDLMRQYHDLSGETVTAAGGPGPAQDGPADTGERVPGPPPRRRASGAQGAGQRLREMITGAGRGGRAGGAKSGTRQAGPAAAGRHRRQSASGVIEHVLSQLAWQTRHVAPLQKVLTFEAAWAGPVLDDAAAGTLVDRLVLQPAAQYEDLGETLNATVGLPLWTYLITRFGGAHTAEVDGQTVPQIDDQGMPVWDDRTRMMVGGLRLSAMSALKVARKTADQIIEAAEESERLGGEADKLVAWILSVRPESPDTIKADAAERARRFARGEDQPDTPPARPGEPVQLRPELADTVVFPPSVVMPAPATGAHGGR